jgi:hypothetical protein
MAILKSLFLILPDHEVAKAAGFQQILIYYDSKN